MPFPYAGTPSGSPNIQCPDQDSAWDPVAGACLNGPGTCQYKGDASVFGGATGVGENYGCAAGNPGWPSSSAAEMETPICKTHVDDW